MKRTDTKLVRHLSQQEMEAVLRAPEVKQRDGIRDRAMLHLAFATGLRAIELVTLPLAAVTITGVPCVRVTVVGLRAAARGRRRVIRCDAVVLAQCGHCRSGTR